MNTKTQFAELQLAHHERERFAAMQALLSSRRLRVYSRARSARSQRTVG